MARAIESLFPIDVEDYEIIVWDNNSTIENKLELEKHVEQSAEKIRYYYSEENLGVGGGRNRAFELAKGEYVFSLDDDAVLRDNKFKGIIDYLDENKDVSAVIPEIYEPETDQFYDCPYKCNDTEQTAEVFTFVGGAHIIRKNAIKTQTLYPLGCRFGSEELYASLLMWDNGFRIVKDKKWLVHHLPTAINRVLGKRRSKLFIVTIYAIRKLTYPRLFSFSNYILFRLHLLKNKIKYDKECKDIIKTTYNKNDVYRIKYKTLRKLKKKFGLKPLI